ncbi:MAG: hypothetical protein A3C93_04975 [Candidatus Lloydbacteria bacterium RIFCSPHIGHO2_02_FULL_54_17]|uniref:Thioredoxin-like fold domain-containing protein n=1 Tax=Candidatus Lloydbacteria bacterium RIFCSPHIGHO2_02_FULL_54_17 TaxID=1798664 RepID=A0A1G2DCI5_9BACT|nr:MAG: hypothetical protein A2762_05760 [Candidatus Lloydbacteria bacterium RIFCSPHIGHO2_01_FULL_54_11]OGZ11122.1 MAG: hypothetical protein A3C93_04975 [Candidatus Lloydbacteria bacterium RIFCSPHIGHO2_02_FULL_54_17]OGZ14514.1 MAG: hypothetical protein A2948_05160 [Candidatus Lloydbacteria bacterium RIFCSPLOWO2_01_FULL_54_18]OGZ16946.1 MAG: hypothetical protein A3H76_03390 [Candidatus Lloydbacteria bacterium RIFCSPLOWO2_02_FULL_54_12]
MSADPKKYLFVFAITALIFGTIFLFSDYLNNERIAQIKSIEENIDRNILESEIQYALLADAACEVGEEGSPLLINELNALARRLSYMEDQRGADDTEVVGLKKYYSLLEIKDYLLLRERTRQCGEKPLSILYFYSNEGDCAECEKMGIVLTSMRERYDTLHVYAFDFNLDLSVIDSLKAIYKLENRLPALVIDRKPYYGFKTREEIAALIPELAKIPPSDTATSTRSP